MTEDDLLMITPYEIALVTFTICLFITVVITKETWLPYFSVLWDYLACTHSVKDLSCGIPDCGCRLVWP